MVDNLIHQNLLYQMIGRIRDCKELVLCLSTKSY